MLISSVLALFLSISFLRSTFFFLGKKPHDLGVRFFEIIKKLVYKNFLLWSMRLIIVCTEAAVLNWSSGEFIT